MLSFVYVPIPRVSGQPEAAAARRPPLHRPKPRLPLDQRLIAGPWEHVAAPASIPAWLREGIDGTIALPSADQAREVELVIRSAQPVVTHGSLAGFVIADVPIGLETVQKLQEETRVRAGTASVLAENADPRVALPQPTSAADGTGSGPRSSAGASSFLTTTNGRPAGRGA